MSTNSVSGYDGSLTGLRSVVSGMHVRGSTVFWGHNGSHCCVLEIRVRGPTMRLFVGAIITSAFFVVVQK